MLSRVFAILRFPRDHAYAQTHLSEYIDGELDAGGVTRVERHVGICPRCRRVLATLRRTVAELRSLHAGPQPRVADGVIERLRDDQ